MTPAVLVNSPLPRLGAVGACGLQQLVVNRVMGVPIIAEFNLQRSEQVQPDNKGYSQGKGIPGYIHFK